MTKKSICMKCAELIRLKLRYGVDDSEEKRICSIDGIERAVLSQVATVQECSRYVEVPGEKKLSRPEGIWIRKDKNGKPMAVGREEAARRDAEAKKNY